MLCISLFHSQLVEGEKGKLSREQQSSIPDIQRAQMRLGYRVQAGVELRMNTASHRHRC